MIKLLRSLSWATVHRVRRIAGSNGSQQGFDTTKVWTPKYVRHLARNMSDRYRHMPVIGRADRFLSDCGSVLDVGCGWMPYTPDRRYTGVDVSEAMLVKARQEHPDIRFYQASAYSLPFDNDAFEGVRSTGMLRHMEDWRPALQEMLRVSTKKLAFSHLIGKKESPCGLYQWCTTEDAILALLPAPAKVLTWEIKSWSKFKSVLFMVEL